MARTVAVVPHTHWDREWYQPFQVFRLRLVDLLDDLLPRLEADPSYARFLLDGQMAMIDDYLELRPHADQRLRRLAASGRLSVGPWYVLMDEFCVSGETIVRNLQLGLERAAAFGGAMEVGYLPDMFGHVAQMPQVLRQAGFEHAVVWRGVPAAVDRTGFRWSAPDGSTVRAEYLPVGYGNGAAVPDDAKALLARIRAHEQELGALLVDGLLWMNGTDHQTPQPWLGRVVAEANALQDDYCIVITSLPEYLATAPSAGLPSWRGELRSGARANLLMGVASNRVDVKQAAARAERALERRAEPLSAIFLPADRWPDAELALAWQEVIRNSAHDSSCACSVDEVVDAVLHRYDQARQIGETLARKALRTLGADLATAGAYVVNPSARARGGVVELVVPDVGHVEGTQVLRERPASSAVLRLTGGELNMVLGRIRNDEISAGADIVAVDADEAEDGVYQVVLTTGVRRRGASVDAPLSDLYAQAGARKSSPLRLRVEREAFQVVLARVGEVAGYGWQKWEPDPVSHPVAGTQRTLDNGLVRLEVSPDDGTFSVNGLAGLDRLVDDGDDGDTYNYSPPARDVVVDQPVAVDVAAVELGPVRGRLRIVRRYEWPAHVVEGERVIERGVGTQSERVGTRAVDVVTVVELRAGEELVRVKTALDNTCRDHRLRSWFPLPAAAAVSRAECAFAVVERGLTAEGGPHEYGLPTFPCRRFVSAGGLTLLHEGLLEYELVDEGKALALTLLRCTGRLSGTDMAYRPWPAGPPLPAPGAQMAGPQVLRYAVHVGDGDPYALADDAFLPLDVVVAGGGGHLPSAGAALGVRGAEVSAVVRRGGALEIRVFNPGSDETIVSIDGRRGWLVDLRGRPLEPFDGSFPLRAWGIATARLDDSN
ncbi:MAG: alpha-mannosidase [Acidimicrobiia bacterium]|nr:alpha-mannosidase [Acidimicrobiia bacterium]